MSDQIQEEPYNLQRFVSAQESVFPQVLEELEQGEKKTHWMWFIFPQLYGLGRSQMALKYAIGFSYEATAYLNHPLLGPRLIRCTELILAIEGRSAEQIFGSIDVCKLKSSMSLFATVAPDQQVFNQVLEKYYCGQLDSTTLNLINSKVQRNLACIDVVIDDDDGYVYVCEEHSLKGYCVDDGISMEEIEAIFSQARSAYGIVFESDLLERLNQLLQQYTKGKTRLSINDQDDIYRKTCEPNRGHYLPLNRYVTKQYIETYCADHNVKLIRPISTTAKIAGATSFLLLVTMVSWYLF